MNISSWQEELRQISGDPLAVLDDLGLRPGPGFPSVDPGPAFPFRAPGPFLERINKNDPHDPLLRQVLPSPRENKAAEGFSNDPVGDLAARTVPGLLHKYHGRVLLVSTAACAIHCRYCFRRHFPYADNNPGVEEWRQALEYIAMDPGITEVILSGGDPLMLADGKLAHLLEKLDAIAHLKRVRIHSRMPVVLPGRITPALLRLLRECRLQAVMVLHVNHANEIGDCARESIRHLAAAGLSLLNQSVLLRGINDSAEALAALSETLFDCRVLPYYLHMLDAVSGAAHFAVEEARAAEIIHELRSILPGYLVPRLVREQAGAPYKMPVL